MLSQIVWWRRFASRGTCGPGGGMVDVERRAGGDPDREGPEPLDRPGRHPSEDSAHAPHREAAPKAAAAVAQPAREPALARPARSQHRGPGAAGPPGGPAQAPEERLRPDGARAAD